jgi:hypothetical protein
LRAFQVDEISTKRYKEHEIAQSPILKASGNGWNADGMHTVDAHKIDEKNWIACVDGKRIEGTFNLNMGGENLFNDSKQLVKKMLGISRQDPQANEK